MAGLPRAAAANLTGNALANTLFAGAGNNILNGGAGRDTVSYAGSAAAVTVNLSIAGAQATGGSGLDQLISIERLEGSSLNDTLTGSTGNNGLSGLGGNDRLNGGLGNDTLDGGAGNDRLNGGTGNDVLTGGADADEFVFNSAPNALTNVDQINDFVSGVDKLLFDDAIFAALTATAGALNAVQFHLGAAATAVEQRLIYDQATGSLFYDSDGLGGSNQRLVATLSPAVALAATDIFVF